MEANKISFLQQSILSLYNLAKVEDVIHFSLRAILKFIPCDSLSILYPQGKAINFFWKSGEKNKIDFLVIPLDKHTATTDNLVHYHTAITTIWQQKGNSSASLEALLDASYFFPIRKDQEDIGLLQIAKEKQSLTEKEEQFLVTFLTHTAQALCLIRQQQKMTSEISRLNTINNFNEILFSVSDIKQICDLIVNVVSNILRVNRVSLLLVEQGASFLNIISGKGLDHHIIKNVKVSKETRITGEALKKRRPLLVPDIEKLFSIRNRPGYYNKSFITYPVIQQNRILGTINISNKIDRTLLSNEDLDYLNEIMPIIARSLYGLVTTAELETLAITDELSQLYNRRYFFRRLTEEFLRSKRYHSEFSLIITDFDKLKEINDLYGHLKGDLVIQKTGELFKKSIRDIDCVARFGGDEFIFLCPKANSQQARILAERIREEIISKPIMIEDTAIPLTLSFGVASFPEDDSVLNNLIKKADEALYQAKAMGGNCVCLYGHRSSGEMSQLVDKFAQEVLNTPLKLRLISFYRQNPAAIHDVSDLAKLLNIAPNWLKEDLEELTKANMLEKTLNYYSYTKDEHLLKLIEQYLGNFSINPQNNALLSTLEEETNSEIRQEAASK